MELLKTFKKFRKLKFKRINGKSAVLYLLNRKLSALKNGRKDFGELIDLQLDRKKRCISFDLSQDDRVSSISIQNYRFIANKGESFLSWSSIDFDGPARKKYGKIFQKVDRIEIPKQYVRMLEKVM
jgi:hypothetical protein